MTPEIEKKLQKLEKSLGIKFKNKTFLLKALIHRSYLNENSLEEITGSNERLEFLGDAVLQFLSSEYLYKTYPDWEEGDLTNLRSKIVNTQALASQSQEMDVSSFLFISKGEKETATESSSILANTFEAILGALYLDQGVNVCRKYLENKLFYLTDEIAKLGSLKDSKSLYQEITQEKYAITPTYKVIKDEGPDHNKVFTIGVFLNEKLIATGNGPSKRKAEQEAAQKALESER